MSKILKNNTASDVFISDTGQTVPASGQLIINPSEYDLYADSNEVITLIGNSTLTVNDGNVDLTIADGSRLLQGLYPTEVGIKAGENTPVIVNFPTAGTDSFGRIRISDPTTLFQSSHIIDKRPLMWDEQITGGATSTYQTNTSSVDMTVSASGQEVIRQTRRYVPYYKGKSQIIDMTFRHHQLSTNVVSELGFGDSLDGVFFGWNGTEPYINVRSSTSGSAVDDIKPQSTWNIDKLNGSGPSGITLNLSKLQYLRIQFSWLGVNEVVWSLVINGNLVRIHKQTYTNLADTIFMRQAILPLRYRLYSIGTPSAPMTLSCLCQHIASEGQKVEIGTTASINSGSTEILVDNNPRLISAVRLNPTFNRFSAKPLSFSLQRISNTETIFWRVLLNPGGNAGSLTWTNTSALLQFNSNTISQATEYTSEYVIESGYIPAGGGQGNASSSGKTDTTFEQDIFLGRTIAGTSDIIAVEARRISGNGSQGMALSALYREFS